MISASWTVLLVAVVLTVFAAGVCVGGLRRRSRVERQWDRIKASTPWVVRATSDAALVEPGRGAHRIDTPGDAVRVLCSRSALHPDTGWICLEQLVVGDPIPGAHPQFDAELDLRVKEAERRAAQLNELLPPLLARS